MENRVTYVCPMHPEIISDKPGKCPKCGGMELIKLQNSKSPKSKNNQNKINNSNHKSPITNHHHHDHSSMMSSPEAAADFLRRFFIVTALLVPLALFSEPAVRFLGMPDFIGRSFLEFGIATVIFYFSLVFFRHARHEIMDRQYGMMTLVSLGVGAGYLFSAASTFLPSLVVEFYLEVSTLIWVLLFGHFLEAKSSSAAGDALAEVAKLLPKEALRLRSGQAHDFEKVAIEDLKEGDVVLVKAGEKVPADGEIVKGGGNFNEAHITGESKPVEKAVKSEVIAGAINIDGSVEVKLMRVGESSTIGQIQNLIASAKQTKPSVQKLADRASRWLTFSALAVALTALVVWSVIVGQPLVFAATLAITVLVIACPHALGLAIPTVSTIATRLSVNNGVFIKDMGKIEIVKGADYVVFDKTGTLTEGNFTVTSVISNFPAFAQAPADRQYPISNQILNDKLSNGQKKLLEIVGAIEAHSSHAIGMAIVSYIKGKKITFAEASNVKNIAGMGMEALVSGKKYFIGKKRMI